MLTLPQVAFAFLTLLVSGLTAGLTGFGLALVATPLLILILPPKVVVPLLALQGIANNLLVLYEGRRWLELRRVDEGLFRRVVLLVVSAAGLLAVASGLQLF